MAVAGWGWEAGDRTFYVDFGWTFSSAGVTVSTAKKHQSAASHGGDYSLIIPAGANALSPTIATTSRWLHIWKGTTAGEEFVMSATFRRSAADTWTVQIQNGIVTLRRGGTGATLVQQDVFTNPSTLADYWVAIQLLAADAGGVSEVWINGVLVSTFSGDTKGAGTADWDQFRITNTAVGPGVNLYVDDIVVTTSGEGQLTERFLPAQRPDGNDAVQLTPSAGTNYQNVDEHPTSTADYNSTTTSGHQDTYTLAALPWTVPSSGVHAVAVWAYCNAQDGALTQVELVTKPTTTSFYSSIFSLLASPTYDAFTEMRNTNPDTAAAWTPSEVDALNVGVRFTT